MHIIHRIEKTNNKKFIFQLDDDSLIEAALFEHRGLVHFCIPNQVGCNIGCKHCSTTYAQPSYIRNLSDNELKEMIDLMIEELWQTSLPWVLSFSGHGEPMMNWDSVRKSALSFNRNFSSIYVTSIGLVSVLRSVLADADFYPAFYFSIHGSSDEERACLIPAAKRKDIANIQQIINFGRLYSPQGGRIIWNYMICSTNSSEKSLQQLLKLCDSFDYPLEIRFTNYMDIHEDVGIEPVSDTITHAFFQQFLQQVPSNISVRLSRLEGEEMGIACGQMRAFIPATLESEKRGEHHENVNSEHSYIHHGRERKCF